MFGYNRGKIGFISPAADVQNDFEFFTVLPDGVEMIVVPTAVRRFVSEDFEKAFSMYPAAAEYLVTQECEAIIAEGSLVFTHMGYDKSREMIQRIREAIGIPVIMNLEAHFDALKELSANKIVIVTPYVEAHTEERKRLCESLGFEVLNTKSLGLQRRIEVQKLPRYTSYKLSMQAILEAHDADAIYISCPEWPTINIIEKLEQDSGKPVVTPVGAEIRAVLRAMHIKESIKGYGKLLEDI